MRTPIVPARALLLTGILFSDTDNYDKALTILESRFGESVMETPAMPWDYSPYYAAEIGDPLYRRFVFFKDLINKDDLASIKLLTMDIEREFLREGKRTVNIDPGYMTSAKLVLASSKNYSHRIYLKDGIYAEVTLMYIHGKFVPHVNTYRDYYDERFLKHFYRARTLYALLSQTKELKRKKREKK